ncbi:hypothetical protein [Amycolatopsis taiwanensis]|uniref:hypothetical protein n=1 Tax=Amycolatopsis taiwanensis TaxID=342230 RepID=UPI0004ADF3F7|nr:hypothetical protein [Amycolatopsis taiwanensis]
MHPQQDPKAQPPQPAQFPAAPGYQQNQFYGMPQIQQQYPQQAFPAAPPVALPPEPGAQPVDSALRLVIILMFVNLGLSVLTTVITLLLQESVIDYQLAHSHLSPDASPAELDLVRHALQVGLWTKLGATVLVAGLYIWRAYALRRGSRGAYIRLYYICIAGVLGIAYLIFAAQAPVWMRVEQGLQAAVLVVLLFAVSRKEVRYRFAKRRYS